MDIFCKIISGEVPADVVFENKRFIVIDDLHPQAPVHMLVIPKEHFALIEDMDEEKHRELLGEMLFIAHEAAHKKGIAKRGYRLILNQNEDGGQAIPHLHLHVLGGKKLGPKIVQNQS